MKAAHELAKDSREAQHLFDELDTNGDGKLSREELLVGFTSSAKDGLSEAQVDALLKQCDTDGDGKVSIMEWTRAWASTAAAAREKMKAAHQRAEQEAEQRRRATPPDRTAHTWLTTRQKENVATDVYSVTLAKPLFLFASKQLGV